jgi:hypothetical protein
MPSYRITLTTFRVWVVYFIAACARFSKLFLETYGDFERIGVFESEWPDMWTLQQLCTCTRRGRVKIIEQVVTIPKEKKITKLQMQKLLNKFKRRTR